MGKITKEEFIKLLDNHDWTYRYSDDPSMEKRGRAKEMNIKSAIENQPEFQKIYADYVKNKFNR